MNLAEWLYIYCLLTVRATGLIPKPWPVSLGGHLATIRNQAEGDWVSAIFGGYGGQGHDLWIGLNYVQKRNGFVWADGERIKYTHWSPGQPNNFNGLAPYTPPLWATG